MDELRGRIWDFLYRSGGPQQIAIIAERMNETPDQIQRAVEDPWFDVRDGIVAIALANR